MIRPKLLFAVALLLLGASLGTSTVLADGVMLNGVSPRSIGRGGTNIGFADNGAVLFDNPAAAVNVEGNGLFDIGTNVLVTDFGYENPRNPQTTDLGVNALPQGALIMKTPGGDWAFGIGVFVPAGFSESYELKPTFPFSGTQEYRSYGSLTKILPGVAYKVTDQFSIGATLGVGLSTASLDGPYFLQNAGPLTGLPTQMNLRGNGSTLVYSFGAQYLITEDTAVGVAYQSASRFQLVGSSDVTAPGLGSTHYDAQIDATWPQQLGFGVKHNLTEKQRVSMDVIWFNWSNAFDEFGLQLTNPTTGGFPPVTDQFPLDWNDTVSYRFGYEHQFTHSQVGRLGYVYNNNPIPTSTLTPWIQGILQHGFSAGYGFTWKKWQIDTAYMFCFSPRIGVEDSAFIGGDFDQSTHWAFTHDVGVSLIRPF